MNVGLDTIALGLAASVGGLVALVYVQRRPQTLLALVAYSLVLTQSFPVFSVGSRVVNLSTDHLLIPLALALAALAPRTWRGDWPWPRFGVPFVLFVGWAVVTFLFSLVTRGPAGHVPALIELSKLMLYTWLFVPAAVFIRNERDARRLLGHLAVGAVIVLVVGYGQWWTIPDRMSANIVSTFGSLARADVITAKNVLAVYLACWLVVVLALFSRGVVGLLPGLLLLAAIGLIIVASYSRAALLAIGVGVAWLAVTATASSEARRVPTPRLPLIVAVVMMGVVVVLGWSAYRGFGPMTPVGQLLNLFATTREYSYSGLVAGATGTLRLRLLWEGLEAFLDAPIVGYGFNVRALHLPKLAVVDNFPLDVALDTGVIGLALMLWLMWEVLQHLRGVQRRASVAGDRLLAALAWAAGGAVMVVYAASVSGSFPYSSRILGPMVLATASLSVWSMHTGTTPRMEHGEKAA
ncbi:MAG TPA: O-antigen ligase family protein [Luteitalea sp.]|nr:O-antigen ligase family protein [Luteitalea sp.]